MLNALQQKLFSFSAVFSLWNCNVFDHLVLLSENSLATENKCHLLSLISTPSSSSPSFTILFWPSKIPPPPSLPSYLLPPSAVAFCQSAHPPGGEGCLIRASSTLPLSFLSPPLSVYVSFQLLTLCRFAALTQKRSPLLTVKSKFKDDIRWLY